nr:hypothetical protein [Methanobacterium formicicum]
MSYKEDLSTDNQIKGTEPSATHVTLAGIFIFIAATVVLMGIITGEIFLPSRTHLHHGPEYDQ